MAAEQFPSPPASSQTFPQDISMPAHCVDQFHGMAVVQLAAEAGDIYFDDVAKFFPVVVVQVLEQLGFGDHYPRPMRQILKHAILDGRERNLPRPPPHQSRDYVAPEV